jgi:hypothetical protein
LHFSITHLWPNPLCEQQQCKELEKEEEKFGKQLDSDIGNQAKQWGKQEQKGTSPGLNYLSIVIRNSRNNLKLYIPKY